MRSLNVNKRELNNRTSNKKQRFLNVKQMAKPKGLFFWFMRSVLTVIFYLVSFTTTKFLINSGCGYENP